MTAAVAAFASCNSGNYTPKDKVESLVLVPSKTVMEADGTDAVHFEVLADGVPVTEDIRLYDGASNALLDLPSMTFTTTEAGTYYFWAAYGTVQSERISVTAVDFALPEIPEDPSPESTSFRRRVLLLLNSQEPDADIVPA